MITDMSLLDFASVLVHRGISYDSFAVLYSSYGDFFGRTYSACKKDQTLAKIFFLDSDSLFLPISQKDSEDARLADIALSTSFVEYPSGDFLDLERSTQGYPSGLLTVLRSGHHRRVDIDISVSPLSAGAIYTLYPESLVSVTFGYSLPNHFDFLRAYLAEEYRLAESLGVSLSNKTTK
jgi:hypothetical protein